MIEIIDIKGTEIKKPAWDKFVESMDFESDTDNFKFEFGVMTKKFGNAFIEYCRAAWVANRDVMDADEFCRINANMPRGFFDKVINKK